QKATRFSRGLRGKFILLISALLITTSLAMGWIFLVREVKDESSKLIQRGALLTRNLANDAELGVFTRNRELLDALASEVTRDTDYAFVVILDARGEALYSRAAPRNRVPPAPSLVADTEEVPLGAEVEDGEVRLYREEASGREAYIFRFPVLTQSRRSLGEEIGFLPDARNAARGPREQIGAVCLALSTEGMKGDIRRLERALGFATLAVIVIGILLTILLVRIIADPVAQLVEATRRIARGDLDVLLRLDSQDEIGELAKSFNQMTLKLQKSREELEGTNQMLEQKVQERTRELEEAQNQLVQAEKMSVVGQLVSGVAHELNNPLAGVLGYSQLLLRMNLPEEVRRGLDKIESEAERCRRIVQNLLIFARKNKAEKRAIDLNALLESVLELKAYPLKVDNIQVVRELEKSLPRVMADASQLQQAFVNILHNAQQAMSGQPSPGTLTVRTHRVDGHVKVEIGDTGPGISPENLSRIFDPFFTTKEVGQGAGLGLSICYGIVQEHRGRIWAESGRGEGSTIHVELPVPAVDELPLPAAPAEEVAAGSTPSARILVVDDEASIVDILYDVLRLDGHQIETAINGRLALNKLRAGFFDVVISDLKMPGMTGQELYRHLRELDSRLLSRIIFTTGDVANPDTQTFLQESGTPYLQKPFDLNEVRRLVTEMVSAQRSVRPDLPIILPGGSRDPDRVS
ncbi:MAG TPA: ATP-binding protein, partial [Candidatus Polarisedimenticolia bacterium]|nr:ATP-binding protein [Candidatus Polarisedimenticolia bacterium]